MNRLNKEEYRESKNCLKRYTYNYITILNIRLDKMSLKGVNYDGMPKSPYNISNPVLNAVIDIDEDKNLKESIKEYKAVIQTKELLNNDSRYILEHLFEKKDKNKWDIIEDLHISEETFKRRYRKLIYTVYEELKKLTQN